MTPDGASATFSESGFGIFLRLTNDPGLSDPNVITPLAGHALTFQYSFVEAAGGNDAFSAFLFDANIGVVGGTLATFALTGSASGIHSFDLTALVGKTLGLEFELAELDPLNGTLGSSATVMNLQIKPVPLPAAIWALAAAAGVLFGWSFPRGYGNASKT